ncbi:MAG: glycosyltransferase, partial [Candidatus Omnitrophica bacterium]|nr:glycosyltransferase [Candidatus Omnitrophota bacterium]
IVRLLNPDLIYERSKIFRYFSLEPLLKKYKAKYFVEVEAPPVELKDTSQDSIFYNLAEDIEIKKYETADTIFTVSKALSEYLISRYNINAKKIHVIHNAADNNLFFPDEQSRSRLRKEMNLEDKIVIGYVGVGYLPWHNLEILCESFRKISKQIKNMFLLLVGPEKKELINRGIDVNSIEEHMLCIGQKSFLEMNKFINAMDICILPGTNWYCSPVKLFEYGAVGRPIIAVDMPNVREIIPDENYALFFKKGDSNDLAEKIRILSLNKDLRNRLGEAFKNYSLSNFNWNKNAQSILKVYRETVKG